MQSVRTKCSAILSLAANNLSNEMLNIFQWEVTWFSLSCALAVQFSVQQLRSMDIVSCLLTSIGTGTNQDARSSPWTCPRTMLGMYLCILLKLVMSQRCILRLHAALAARPEEYRCLTVPLALNLSGHLNICLEFQASLNSTAPRCKLQIGCTNAWANVLNGWIFEVLHGLLKTPPTASFGICTTLRTLCSMVHLLIVTLVHLVGADLRRRLSLAAASIF